MPKKPKHVKAPPRDNERDELWLAPKYNLKGPMGDRAWDDRTGGAPSHSRYLELADIALGHKKPTPKKKTTPVHDLVKNDPYTLRQKKM